MLVSCSSCKFLVVWLGTPSGNMLDGDTVTPGTRLLRSKREPPRPQEPHATPSRHRPSRDGARQDCLSLLSWTAEAGAWGPGTPAGQSGSEGPRLVETPPRGGRLSSGHSPRPLRAQLCAMPPAAASEEELLWRMVWPMPSFHCDHDEGFESFHCPEIGVTLRFNAGEGPGHT